MCRDGNSHRKTHRQGNVVKTQEQRERYSRWARRASSVLGGKVDLRVERYLLKRSWAHIPAERLQGYLVGGYQNPTINVQSIIARHTIVREIDGDKHDALMEEELRWAVEKHRQLRSRQRELTAEYGIPWPKFKRSKIWRAAYKEILGDDTGYATRWSEALRDEPGRRLSVIEAACGSANDYRFFDAYGIAPLLAYTGFDLTQQNITNARRMFPGVDFQLGDVQDIQAEDASYDWAIAHDLLEHLSPTAFNRAIEELCRVTRRGILISFFSMNDSPEHVIQPRRDYHVNQLSRRRTEERFAAHCSQVEWLHIRSMLKERYDFNSYYNGRAWTMIARH
jgi:SAM-dependent methyltransferase